MKFAATRKQRQVYEIFVVLLVLITLGRLIQLYVANPDYFITKVLRLGKTPEQWAAIGRNLADPFFLLILFWEFALSVAICRIAAVITGFKGARLTALDAGLAAIVGTGLIIFCLIGFLPSILFAIGVGGVMAVWVYYFSPMNQSEDEHLVTE
ncbi:hypothetical protein ACFPAF_17140 [Hymenobacter endophyticus]|uniref:Uncharacterized protein n=1 Tax=Hymenobacter endophyticus TaxID=3076335 RepID=A0ABU3TL82_9BACT|nr:hypothetical protein [Hymenobacter endophyticus]MDU0372131.1 hypothetical protein [Hymenobacter endophyticus]